MPEVCRTRGDAVDASGTDFSGRLSSKVEQHRLATAAGLGLAAEVHDDPGTVDLTVGRLVLLPEFGAGTGSAVLSTPGLPPPADLLDGLRRGGRVLAHRWVDGVPHHANGVVVAGELLLTDCWEWSVLEDGNRVRLTSVVNLWPGSAAFRLLAERLQAFLTVAGIAWGPGAPGGGARRGRHRAAGLVRAAGCRRATVYALRRAGHRRPGRGAAGRVAGRRRSDRPAPGPGLLLPRPPIRPAGRDPRRRRAARPAQLRRNSGAAGVGRPRPPGRRRAARRHPAAAQRRRADLRADIAYYQARNAEGIFLLEDGPGGDT
jgi:hypothetical protein